MEKTFDLTGMKVAISVPCYKGVVPVDWVVSFSQTQNKLVAHGVKSYMQVRMNSGLIHSIRNELVHTALQSEDTTHILFVDDDILWNADDVLRLLSWSVEKPFVCGVYCARNDDPTFFVDLYLNDGNIVQDENMLMRAKGVPAGFMLLKREVFEDAKLIAQCPKTLYKRGDLEGEIVNGYFDYIHEGLTAHGEDISFCRRWTRAGGEIWIDPAINLRHVGVKAYNHSYIQWIKERQRADDSNGNDGHSDADRVESGSAG